MWITNNKTDDFIHNNSQNLNNTSNEEISNRIDTSSHDKRFHNLKNTFNEAISNAGKVLGLLNLSSFSEIEALFYNTLIASTDVDKCLALAQNNIVIYVHRSVLHQSTEIILDVEKQTIESTCLQKFH